MIVKYTKLNEYNEPLDKKGNVIPLEEGKQRLFNGEIVMEFDSAQERDEYLDTIYPPQENEESN